MNDEAARQGRPDTSTINASNLASAGDVVAIPYVEIVIPLEGRATGLIHNCHGDETIGARLIDWVEHDPDLRDLVDAFRRLRDRQAA